MMLNAPSFVAADGADAVIFHLPQTSEDEISFLYLTVGSTSSHLTELSFGLADRLTSKSATKPNATKSVGNSPNPIAVAIYRLNVGKLLE